MLPLSDQRTSSSLGSGVAASRALAASIMPGVQKPHCRPCSCLKAAWMGWSWPSLSSPSTVSIPRPSACTARNVQDLIGTPSTSTVQAPHPEVSQPMCVPVSPTCSRRKWTSSLRGSTSALCSTPLTVTVISMPGTSSSRCGIRGLAEHLVAGLGADQRLLRGGGRQVGRADRGEADPHLGDVMVVREGEADRDRRGGEVPDLSLELEIGAAAAGPGGHARLDQQLIRLEVGGEGPAEEVEGGDGALAGP